MLSQLVRPMVQTQIRLLANSRATRSTLVSTIAQWLGFLGVRAQVTQLDATANQIHITLTVNKPEACDARDWQQILDHLGQNQTDGHAALPDAAHFTPQQQRKMQRLLAYLIQVGNPDDATEWGHLEPQLRSLGFDELTLAGVRAALKVPQSADDLLEELDPDLAAVTLPKAVHLAIMDRHVNPSEDMALTALLQAMKKQTITP